jgi:hypothetical protein
MATPWAFLSPWTFRCPNSWKDRVAKKHHHVTNFPTSTASFQRQQKGRSEAFTVFAGGDIWREAGCLRQCIDRQAVGSWKGRFAARWFYLKKEPIALISEAS